MPRLDDVKVGDNCFVIKRNLRYGLDAYYEVKVIDILKTVVKVEYQTGKKESFLKRNGKLHGESTNVWIRHTPRLVVVDECTTEARDKNIAALSRCKQIYDLKIKIGQLLDVLDDLSPEDITKIDDVVKLVQRSVDF